MRETTLAEHLRKYTESRAQENASDQLKELIQTIVKPLEVLPYKGKITFEKLTIEWEPSLNFLTPEERKEHKESTLRSARIPRPQIMSDGNNSLFPSYPRRKEIESFPNRPSDQFTISEIAKVGNMSINQAEALVKGAFRRDVIHLSMILQRAISDDPLIERISQIRDCTREDAISFIAEYRKTAERLFRENEIKAFIKKYNPAPERDLKEEVQPDPEEVRKQEKKAEEELDKLLEELDTAPLDL